jgi:hypothetical protein
VSAESAKEVAEKTAELLNKFEGESSKHNAYLTSCCCQEALVISDGDSKYYVVPVFTGDPENPAYRWKAVKQ